MNVLVGEYAGVPVADSTRTHLPTSIPLPSRLRSCTVASYSLAGTAVAESFWSVRLSSPLDWTGLTLKTLAVPVDVPGAGLVAPAGDAASTGPTRPNTAIAAIPIVR